MPIPVILDCDPGHDDALAILLALHRPELNVRAITTVAGNVDLAATTRNAQAILTLANRSDVPVAAGADRPLVRRLQTAAQVHGTSGLEGADLPEPTTPLHPRGAVALIAETVSTSAEPVTLVPTGPLTNIALFLGAHPELRSRIARICLMGGSMGEGNWTASAEFNIWVDPHAAACVFGSGIPVTQVTIDVTHQAIVPVAESDAWVTLGTRTGRVFANLFRFFAAWHARRYGWDGSPIHDAVAVAHLAFPGLVRTEDYRVDVETVSELTLGRTVIDRERLSGKDPNASVSVGIDRGRFLAEISATLTAFP